MGSIFRITKRTLELDPDRDTTSIVKMSRPGYKTKSDTMLLRRLINNLKERGSEVAEELERKAHNFLTDVKSKKKPALQSFESDEESEWEGSEWEEEEEVPFSLPPPPARLSLPIPSPVPPPPRQATPPPPSPLLQSHPRWWSRHPAGQCSPGSPPLPLKHPR